MSTDSVDIAYLCVFNTGEWQPIQWGRISDNKVTFKDMAPDIVYLPALYLNGKIVPCGQALLLSKSGKPDGLSANAASRSEMTVVSTTKRSLEASTDSVEKSFLEPGVTYELFYWQDGWTSLGQATAGDSPLHFENVPAGGLYRLTSEDSDHEERIFTYAGGHQVWW